MNVKKVLFVVLAVLSIAALSVSVGCDGDPDHKDDPIICGDAGDPGCGEPPGGDPTVPPTPVPGEPFVDPRDGQSYPTIKVGGVTWMAKNLNFATPSGSWCHGDKDSSCAKYGRLYDWETALNSACPEGWILPDNDYWDDLRDAADSARLVDGTRLKSATLWNGTDDYGFAALPGGGRDGESGSFGFEGEQGTWWSASDFGGGRAFDWIMRGDSDVVAQFRNNKGDGHSVRCVAGRLPARR